ncbi:MAG TPA: tRNA lysidine(34) synthetase TilS [Gemmatimonadales bacterium]|nr:tRNA lysidine(34) synthetase TilS [Gemmatimonadales bacterium]
MSLIARFRAHLAELAPSPGPALVAVSGGPDSAALLDLLTRTAGDHRLELIVAHVDHGISAESGEVADLVRRAAERYSVPFEIERLALGPGATETVARERRYAALRRVARRTGARVIVTAHHADDQAETVLMRLLRGSGPAGLAAMRPRPGLLRPLLPFRREELARYVQAHRLEAWEDPANADPRHLRSWLRQEIMPKIESTLPDLVPRLMRTARQAGRQLDAWDAALGALPELDPRVDVDGVSVAAHALARYDSALGEALVAALGRRAGCVIGPARGARLVRLAATGKSGAMAPLGAGWAGEVAFGRLAIRRLPVPPAEEVRLDSAAGEVRWGRWCFRIGREPAPERQGRTGMTAWFPGEPITVRASRPGDRIVPLGGPGRRRVVRCFQDARVSKLSRGAWPVLTAGGSVVWVPGVCRAEERVPPAGSEALRVDVSYE